MTNDAQRAADMNIVIGPKAGLCVEVQGYVLVPVFS